MVKKFVTKLRKRHILIGIVAILAVLAVVVAGSVGQMNKQANTIPKQETAYANVVKDSLNVFYARYEKYPKDYQALISDIRKTPELYGVNEEGIAELIAISSRLRDFSYSVRPKEDGYEFTYVKQSGSKVTVKSE